MREIIFRGKHEGKWVYGSLLIVKPNEGILEPLHYYICPLEVSDMYRVDPSTVGQYTGKKVKTGEVFQDDIGKSIDGLFLVAWDEEKAAFVMHFYDYPKETLYLEEMWDDAEIIGNLHDNPELLKE